MSTAWDRIISLLISSYFMMFLLIPTVAWSFYLVLFLVIYFSPHVFNLLSSFIYFFYISLFFSIFSPAFFLFLPPFLPPSLSVCVLLCGRCAQVWTLRSLWVLCTHQPLFHLPFTSNSLQPISHVFVFFVCFFLNLMAVWNHSQNVVPEFFTSFYIHVYWYRK